MPINNLDNKTTFAGGLTNIRHSIGTKIVLPYLLLTIVVASAGAFIVTNLVASTLEERFNNQLLDSGRIVAESMVNYEDIRLEIMRAVAGTDIIAEGLADESFEMLENWVPQIIANSSTDAVELLNMQGVEVFGWQRPPTPNTSNVGESRSGADYAALEEVKKVLDGVVDEFGEKRVLLSETPQGLMIFSVGPVYVNEQRVGAVMVGTYVHKMLVELTETALARVTLYDRTGQVIDTTLGIQGSANQALQEPPERYQTVIDNLQESPDSYAVIAANAEDTVPLKDVDILGQTYTLAYGDWRLRGQSFGLFSVALPRNFIISTTTNNRVLLSILFTSAMLGVFAVGIFITQRIIQPLNKLVKTAVSVTQGNLDERADIESPDEIGTLAHSFDMMTENLVDRNRLLQEKTVELEAILNSIADGVLVLDSQGNVSVSNPAAQRMLGDFSESLASFSILEPNILEKLATFRETGKGEANGKQSNLRILSQRPQRYRIGNQVISALAASVQTNEGDNLGQVIALRDITREANIEHVQDGFITSISHELRTPLTSVKGYSDILLKLARTKGLDDSHTTFIETINRNADKLVAHINQLIDISEIQAGTLTIQKKPLMLTKMVKQLIDDWQDKIAERDLNLKIQLPKDELFVLGDEKRLCWAIDNLLSNAYNYTEHGGIEVVLFEEDEEARLDIIDTGVGISTADQPYLFTRFFRATSDDEFTFNIKGLGLGLYVTRSIAKLHGGRAWAKSKITEGSTFSLAIPLTKETET